MVATDRTAAFSVGYAHFCWPAYLPPNFLHVDRLRPASGCCPVSAARGVAAVAHLALDAHGVFDRRFVGDVVIVPGVDSVFWLMAD